LHTLKGFNAQRRTCADSIQCESAREERVRDSLLLLIEDDITSDEGQGVDCRNPGTLREVGLVLGVDDDGGDIPMSAR
jgi:hypothetical protein